MHYVIFSQELQSAALGAYTGWGIEGISTEGSVLRVEDVTEDRAYAALLAAVLNREAVEPVHVVDIITDFLAEPGILRALSGNSENA